MDFSQLDDEQIPVLVQMLCQEAMKRGMHVAAATQKAMLDEAEKARIAQQEHERVIAQQRYEQELAERNRAQAEARKKVLESSWKQKRQVAQLIAPYFTNGAVSVGPHPKLGRMVSFKERPKAGGVMYKKLPKVYYYAEGNDKYPPDHIRFLNFKSKPSKSAALEMRKAARLASELFTQVEFPIKSALAGKEEHERT